MPAESSADSSLSVSELRLRVEELEARLQSEREEAQHREAAVSALLQAINASAGNLAPVFDALLEKAMHLCGAAFGILRLWDGSHFHSAASRGVPAAYAEFLAHNPQQPQPGSIGSRIVSGEPLVHVLDVAHQAIDSSRDPHRRALAELGGARTSLVVALTRDRRMLGAIQLYRQHVQAFSDKQIALLQNFAAQAVIAMENARLLSELRQRTDDLTESLDQQTATADILRVISQSPTDIQPVLDAVAGAARHFCGAPDAIVLVRDGDHVMVAAHVGTLSASLGRRWPITTSWFGHAMRQGRPLQIADSQELDPTVDAEMLALARQHKWRAASVAPMMREGEGVGCILLRKPEPGPLSQRHVALQESFAAQAVIAIENVRLFTELRESLAQQTATADVLRVISQSPTDVAPVLDAVVKAAVRFCGAIDAVIILREGEQWMGVAHEGPLGAPRARRLPLNRDTAPGRSMVDRQTIHYPDIGALDPAEHGAAQANAARMGFSSVVSAPLLRDNEAIGAIALRKREAEPFKPRQIALLESFAAQAVIALENTRLFTELRQRTDDLTESLEYQTATSEVLEVISRSTSDLQPVLDTMLAAALRLCDVQTGGVAVRRGDNLHYIVTSGHTSEFAQFLRNQTFPINRSNAGGRAVLQSAVVHIPDIEVELGYTFSETLRLERVRTMLSVPLMRQGEAVGVITMSRTEVQPFTERQIALVRTFADQAVIAMENTRLLSELREALDQQTANAEVLQIINGSPGELAPVFEAMLERAVRLSDASFGIMNVYEDGHYRAVATRGVPSGLVERWTAAPPPGPRNALTRIAEGEDLVHIEDLAVYESYRLGDGRSRALVETGGARSLLAVALRKDRVLLGTLTAYRQEVKPFTEKQVALFENFAAQAVIAMENARLINETREALAQQTATAEVLQVINSSPGLLEPVFEAMLEKSLRLCEADAGFFGIYAGDGYSLAALQGLSAQIAQAVRDSYRTEQQSRPPHPESSTGRIMRGEGMVHILDSANDAVYRSGDPGRRSLVDVAGARTQLCAALRKDGVLLGVILIWRREVRPFTDKQIALLQSFAAQAVIAMENARLLSELRDRQAELRVTFDNMGDGVAMFDAEPRLAAWNRNFEEIISLPETLLAERPSYADYLRMLAERGEFGTENVEAELASRLENTDRELRLERTRADGTVIEVRRNAVPGGGFVLIYSDVTEQRRAEAAIRAARDDAEAALERQTATADILRVIAGSPSDVQPVFEAIAERSNRLIGGVATAVYGLDNDVLQLMSFTPVNPEADAALRAQYPSPLSKARKLLQDAVCDRRVHQLSDVELELGNDPEILVIARLRGWRSAIAVPLIHEGETIGVITVTRAEPGLVDDPKVELLKTFAAQAVIAIENVRLFTELRDSLERLKAAQANLIQAEKMASLGQLTAGIAHEIKNPLNFVNNFAGLSVELLDELRQAATPVLTGMSEDARAEFGETVDLISSNLEKIVEHGRRADGIVKSMLAHSRGGIGDWQASNINALVEEALNLAYHGARAQDQDFNVMLERDFAPETKSIEVVPQDVTRVFLNLFGNGFYAAKKRQLSDTGAGYVPTLTVTTRDLGEAVEIRVRDNGTGIPPEVRAKLFQPFFTTKPTGEGTGLGLSISYDIVTQQHGGSIEVESEPGSFTEFTVRLPRRRRAA